MNAELLAVLDHMEREKGVSREVLIDAIETALVSAAKKVIVDKEAEVEAKIDPLTGAIDVFSNGVKIESKEFGRIAAQSAKQVIIQKIRDAEREVIFEEYEPKVNQLVSGTIFRHDKGTVVIDLGKAEAILPKREQSPRDVYRQGDRIRAHLIEASKATRGPQIIVSRNHPGLVKRLFEIEVPEVYESIVEIKGVSREAGDRSKIAVWSKDEKVDCVGACVGMRGSRVKNIVRELQGEKIDIVRWNEDIIEYIRAALSPAECSAISIENVEEKKVKVIVEDDQLSLAIGKSGQNVRLASKLTGWSIDIKSKGNIARDLMGADALDGLTLEEMSGLDADVIDVLKKAKIDAPGQLRTMSIAALGEIEGIDADQAKLIQTAIKAVITKYVEKKLDGVESDVVEKPSSPDADVDQSLLDSVKSNLLSRELDTEVKSDSTEAVQEESADQTSSSGEDQSN
ncbi:MAG: N utilization substance protein A [Candidatus Omnitrophota bacterium]|jgi:N utilization substance protein A